MKLIESPVTLNQIIAIAVGLIVLTLSGLTWYYHGAYRNVSDTLLVLQHDVSEKNREATDKLKALIIERDAKQAKINQLYLEQGEKDEIAQNGIERLNDQLRASTVRVRIESASRCSGSSSIGDQARNAANSAANDTETSGVLPESNTRRLADALTEIETLSAAYNSCRAVLSN